MSCRNGRSNICLCHYWCVSIKSNEYILSKLYLEKLLYKENKMGRNTGAAFLVRLCDVNRHFKNDFFSPKKNIFCFGNEVMFMVNSVYYHVITHQSISTSLCHIFELIYFSGKQEKIRKEMLSHRLHKVVLVFCVFGVLPVWQKRLFGFFTPVFSATASFRSRAFPPLIPPDAVLL